MLLAIDVHYRSKFAKVVSVEFDNWKSKSPSEIHSLNIADVAEYIPGQFYKRELPCILKILELSNLESIEAIIVDGYVVLDDNGKLGLGGHLYEALDKEIPIIGVAKKRFYNNEKNVVEVLRGKSIKPLYISAINFDLEEAGSKVTQMAGDYRFPEMLKILDVHTKNEN